MRKNFFAYKLYMKLQKGLKQDFISFKTLAVVQAVSFGELVIIGNTEIQSNGIRLQHISLVIRENGNPVECLP